MTKQRVLIATTLGVLLAGGLVFGGERSYKPSSPQKAGYSTDLNVLRAKFNADKGKVRLLIPLLDAPTPRRFTGAQARRRDASDRTEEIS